MNPEDRTVADYAGTGVTVGRTVFSRSAKWPGSTMKLDGTGYPSLASEQLSSRLALAPVFAAYHV